jgi:hypothetical protein
LPQLHSGLCFPALLRSQPGETAGFRRAFMQINVYALMITLFLSLGALTA